MRFLFLVLALLLIYAAAMAEELKDSVMEQSEVDSTDVIVAGLESDRLSAKAHEFFFDDNNDYRFHAGQVALPAVLVSIGAWGVENGWICRQKRSYRDLMDRLCGGHKTKIDNYMQYAPWATQLALPAFGVKGKHPYREKIASTLTAFAIMNVFVLGLKNTINEKRPDSSAHNSFPSGHTATAFCGAELIQIEYGGWYGAAAYISALGVGFLRPYNSRHWLNDVFAGAAIGIFSARAAYWLLPAERKWFGWNKKKDSPAMVATPFWNGNSVGASVAVSF